MRFFPPRKKSTPVVATRRFPKGDRRLRLFSLPFGRLRRGEIPATTKSSRRQPQKLRRRRFPKGDRKALWSRPQARNPCLRKRAALVVRPATWSRPFGATICKLWVERLGGASADAQSYWQGRFAACTFVERVWHTGRPWNSWGVAPNPTRELRPLTPQGTLSLDPFSAARLERFSHAVPFWGFLPFSLTGTRT